MMHSIGNLDRIGRPAPCASCGHSDIAGKRTLGVVIGANSFGQLGCRARI